MIERRPASVATPPVLMELELLYRDGRDLTGRPLRDRRMSTSDSRDGTASTTPEPRRLDHVNQKRGRGKSVQLWGAANPGRRNKGGQADPPPLRPSVLPPSATGRQSPGRGGHA